MALSAAEQGTYARTDHDGVDVVSDDRRTYYMNSAAWGAIIAGVVTAVLVQVLLSLLGVGIGLTSFQVTGNTADNPTVAGITQTAAIWWVVAGLIASFAGGIVSGRLSGSSRHSTASWHGFVTWCASTLVIVWLIGSAVGGVLGGTFSAMSQALGGVGSAAKSAVSEAAGGLDANSLDAKVKSLVNPNETQSVQDSVTAYIRASVSGDQQAADAAKGKAVDSLAKAANISPDEARGRIEQLQQQAQQAADKAKEAAEQTRKNAGQGALFAFAALLLGAIAGIIGGGVGTPRRAALVR